MKSLFIKQGITFSVDTRVRIRVSFSIMVRIRVSIVVRVRIRIRVSDLRAWIASIAHQPLQNELLV